MNNLTSNHHTLSESMLSEPCLKDTTKEAMRRKHIVPAEKLGDTFQSTDSIPDYYHPVCSNEELTELADAEKKISENCATELEMESRTCQHLDGNSIEKSSKQSSKIEGKEAWITLAAVFLSNIINGINWISFAILYVEYCEYFQASKSDAGWVGSIHNAVSQLMGLVVSSPIQMFGCKKVGVIGGFVMSSGIFLSSFAPNLFFLYFSYGLLAGKFYIYFHCHTWFIA